VKPAVLLIVLAGCAAPACRPMIEHVSVPAVEHVVPTPDTRGPDALIAEYAAIQRAEKRFVTHTGPGHIHKLIALDKTARAAMSPIAASDHVATPAEMQRAVAVLGELRAFLSTPKVK
jgi:hypothetical protein